MATYGIDNMHGEALASALTQEQAHAEAQRLADGLGESVWLYIEGDLAPAAEVKPRATDAEIDALIQAAAQAGDLLTVGYGLIARGRDAESVPLTREQIAECERLCMRAARRMVTDMILDVRGRS